MKFTAAIVALFLSIAITSSVWDGLVFMLLWRWLIAGTFGLPPLSLAQAIGVMLVFHYLTHRRPRPSDADDGGLKAAMSNLVYAFVMPAVALGIGFLIHLFL